MAEFLKNQKYLNLIGVFLVIIFCGFFGAYAIGPERLNIFKLDWLTGDLATVYVAWIQYTFDPSAGWLTTMSTSYPLQMSISLFDPMPLPLVLLKPFASLVPESTQYFGIYFLICLVLQSILGYFISQDILRWRGFSTDYSTILISVCCGLLFASTPFTLNRMLAHTALFSQWLLVLSILVALRTRNSRNPNWMIINSAIVFLACGFNPYLAVMVALSLAGFTAIFLGSLNWRIVAKRVTVLFITGLIGLYAFGFMSGASVPEGGYGYYSMNMLGPFDSNGQGLLLSLDINDATGGQAWEGFNYLGLGVIILIVIALLVRRYCGFATERTPLSNAWLVVLISYLLALSATLTLSSEVLKLPLPQSILDLLSRFRASGRFFWIGGFWLIAMSFAEICSRLAKFRILLIIFICVAVQIVDIFGILRGLRLSGLTVLSLPIPQVLDMSANGRSEIIVLPPWQCDFLQTPGGIRGFEIFGVLAARKHMNINSYYAARTLPEQKLYHCDYQTALSNLSQDTMYVLSGKLYSENSAKFKGYHCSELPIEGTPLLCVYAAN